MCAYKRDVVVVIETSAYTYFSMAAYYPVFRSRAVDRKYCSLFWFTINNYQRGLDMMDVHYYLLMY